MAVYTEVSLAALSTFMSHYPLGRVLAYTGIAEGVENTNYSLTMEKGRYFLTLFEKRVDPDDLPFFLGLMEHLAGKGLPCPTPVRDNRGAMLSGLVGKAATVITFLNGQSVAPADIAVHHCAGIGAALAQLHQAGMDFPIRRANALGPPGWAPLFQRFRSDVDTISPGLGAAISDELAYLASHWPPTSPQGLPHGVIHADLFPDNAFFLDGRFSGMIDFYFACNDALAYDLAVCLNAWCFDAAHQFQPARAAALLASYQTVRALTDAEWAALPVFARGSALRFLLTRAHDWIHTPPDALVARKDPGEYLAKLRYHQTVRDGRSYGSGN